MSLGKRSVRRASVLAVAVVMVSGCVAEGPIPVAENPFEAGVLPTWEVASEDPTPDALVKVSSKWTKNGSVWRSTVTGRCGRVVSGLSATRTASWIRAGRSSRVTGRSSGLVGASPTGHLPDPCGTDEVAIVGEVLDD